MAVFVAANLVVPFAAWDLYPFSVFPMFSAHPSTVSRVAVYGPDGAILDAALLETWALDVSSANPRTGFAVRSLDPGSRALEEADVQTHVGRLLRERDLPFAYVDVEQTLATIGTDGGVAVTKTRWRVAK